MSLILYRDTETSFASNGRGILTDTLSATVFQELNGMLELEFTCPASGLHVGDIVMRSLITAKPDPATDSQPFRVYRINKKHPGLVKVYARHVAYDAIGIPIAPFQASGLVDTLNKIRGHAVIKLPFTLTSDKSSKAEMKTIVPMPLWSLLGGVRGSLLDVYGGEYQFDKFHIKLCARRGEDRGVYVRYGKNLRTAEQDANCAATYTGVYPYWLSQDGQIVQLPEYIVAAGGTYNYTRIKVLDLSAEWEDAPTVDQLRSRAQRYIEENDIGTPVVSWEIGLINPAQETAFMDLMEKNREIELNRMLLGDTIHVVFPEMGVNGAARVVRTEYDPLLERYQKIVLGSLKKLSFMPFSKS